jgi:ribose/xylose/arabinose/galactoside ABC-type transport system permease subunit
MKFYKSAARIMTMTLLAGAFASTTWAAPSLSQPGEDINEQLPKAAAEVENNVGSPNTSVPDVKFTLKNIKLDAAELRVDQAALAKILQINIGNLSIPTGSILFFALLAFGMWAFLHTKTGTAMTAVGSNPEFARSSGVNVDKIRLISVVMSTWLAAIGILVYEQGFGFIQLYMAPFYMALPAVSAILIGGASVNKASVMNVIIGTILFQGIVTMTPTVMNNMIHLDMSEVIRIIVSNGMILYALTRKTEETK